MLFNSASVASAFFSFFCMGWKEGNIKNQIPCNKGGGGIGSKGRNKNCEDSGNQMKLGKKEEKKSRNWAVSFTHIITQIVAIGDVFILLPAYFVVLVIVIVLPVFVHIFLNVPPLPVFDPIMQLCMADVAILVCVNAVHNLPVRADGERFKFKFFVWSSWALVSAHNWHNKQWT